MRPGGLDRVTVSATAPRYVARPAASSARACAHVSIVIVAHRSRALLKTCLASIPQPNGAAAPPYRIWVVDNDSRDGTVEMLAAEHPEIVLIANSHNAGFGAANNQAFAHVTGRYVLLVNPDVRLEPSTIQRALEVLDANPQIGALGGRLALPDGGVDHATRVQLPTLLGALGHLSGLARFAWAPAALRQYRVPELPDGSAGPVGQVSGAMMFLRRSALEQVGTFDESYWMYVEDTDLCRRLREAGWLVWFEPTVRGLHLKGSISGRPRRPSINWAFHRSLAIFYSRHYAPDRCWAVNVLVYLGIYGRFGMLLLSGGLVRARHRLRGAPRARSW